jgi:hypothetical protein
MNYYYKGLRDGINIFAKSRYQKEANDICENAKEIILAGIESKCRVDMPNHSKAPCGFAQTVNGEQGRRTEKRFCRCLVNYDKRTEKENIQCKDCCMNVCHNLAKSFVGKDNAKVNFIDYEVAVSEGNDSIGGIDLLLEYNAQKYAVEFKPEWNTETLLRMISEITTYCYIAQREGKLTDYKKAIMFMYGSEQYDEYIGLISCGNEKGKTNKYGANKAIFKMLNDLDISVFCLNTDTAQNVYVLEKLQ